MSVPSRRAEIMASLPALSHITPSGFQRWSEDAETRASLRTMISPHPRSCFDKGVSWIADPSEGPFRRSYIHCARHDLSPFRQFHDWYVDDPCWHSHSLDCPHEAMIDRPDEVLEILLDA